MIAREIQLVGTYIDHNTSHKDWWNEHLKGENIVPRLEKFRQEIDISYKEIAFQKEEEYKKLAVQ